MEQAEHFGRGDGLTNGFEHDIPYVTEVGFGCGQFWNGDGNGGGSGHGFRYSNGSGMQEGEGRGAPKEHE